MEYGDVIYDCLSVKDAATLQKLQNACLKHVLQLPRLTSTTYIHETLNLQYLNVRRKQHVATQMYRIDQNLAPPHINDRFTHRSNVSSKTTRNTCMRNYEIPRTKLEMTKRNFVYHGVQIWYQVPYELKVATNPKSFKCEIAKVWKRDGDVGVTYSLSAC